MSHPPKTPHNTCALGKLYRFVEPLVLYLLKKKGRAYGYELLGEINDHALTNSRIERGALYRTLRTLEDNGNVISDWDVSGTGPARRRYQLTQEGEAHLVEWSEIMSNMAKSMSQFVLAVDELSRCRPEKT